MNRSEKCRKGPVQRAIVRENMVIVPKSCRDGRSRI
ncbi:hypothetical protein P343_08610 [Sporolactobacillus laevolacticus DSM 442]|uniref:Uncharacterized protein n=1 Tax=Sporolactobacillus laevolacticus DSM 442 TaxID=1395513 RepID=V6IY02_9BACL|nr:hypothetical protein P343_08610 [Sporolactobacillus laevolacticus DSM 442]